MSPVSTFLRRLRRRYALRFLFQRHHAEAPTARGVFDQRRQSPRARLFFFCAGDPVDRYAAVARRLRVEELPSLLIRAEFLLVLSWQRAHLVLVRVDRGLLLAPLLERAQPGGLHSSELRQLRDARDVDRAPGARLFSRRETDAVTDVVDAPPHAVDPAEAERLIDRLRPSDGRLPRVLLVKADQELGSRGMVLRQPL